MARQIIKEATPNEIRALTDPELTGATTFIWNFNPRKAAPSLFATAHYQRRMIDLMAGEIATLRSRVAVLTVVSCALAGLLIAVLGSR
jgi:hypothetical protein